MNSLSLVCLALCAQIALSQYYYYPTAYYTPLYYYYPTGLVNDATQVQTVQPDNGQYTQQQYTQANQQQQQGTNLQYQPSQQQGVQYQQTAQYQQQQPQQQYQQQYQQQPQRDSVSTGNTQTVATVPMTNYYTYPYYYLIGRK